MAKTKGKHQFDINVNNDRVQLNTSLADGRKCAHCHIPITLIRRTNGVDRTNRIDCEDGTHIVSYHIVCYDMLVVGKITRTTKKRLQAFHEEGFLDA